MNAMYDHMNVVPDYAVLKQNNVDCKKKKKKKKKNTNKQIKQAVIFKWPWQLN